ncbi:MAG: hypothetical protein DBW82_06890 [Synechococcus sp. MED-G68]|nr:MAG: hypothetical protein DBW82_06890 [Synechococcus sp. MED-G68]
MIDGEDGRDESDVEGKEQPSDRKSNHCHILTNTNATLRDEICSKTENRRQRSQNTAALSAPGQLDQS